MFWKINLDQSVGLHKNNLDCVSIKNSLLLDFSSVRKIQKVNSRL